MKSDVVSSPANVDLLESQSGAETMPTRYVNPSASVHPRCVLTILDQYIKTLLDEEIGIEDDQSKAQGQDIVTGADLEKGSDTLLWLL
jgi:predicted short-subunit dehydrogenase-like oxidoreductase (DUF2520 family)